MTCPECHASQPLILFPKANHSILSCCACGADTVVPDEESP